MTNLQWYDWVRFLTMLLALVSLYLSARRFRKNRKTYTRRLKDLWWAMNALLILVIEGSLEAIVSDVPGGPRTILSFLVSLVCLRATTRDEGYIIDK